VTEVIVLPESLVTEAKDERRREYDGEREADRARERDRKKPARARRCVNIVSAEETLIQGGSPKGARTERL